MPSGRLLRNIDKGHRYHRPIDASNLLVFQFVGASRAWNGSAMTRRVSLWRYKLQSRGDAWAVGVSRK
jgi:hypothetical protein